MSQLESLTATGTEALVLAATHLAKGDQDSRPVAIVASFQDRNLIIKQECLVNQIGIRLMRAGDLLAAVGLDQEIGLDLIASLENELFTHNLVTRTSLFSQVYGVLKDSNLGSPMTLAGIFRDTLLEMDTTCKSDKFDHDKLTLLHNNYETEITFLLSLWDSLVATKRQQRSERLAKLASDIQGPVVFLHRGRPHPLLVEFMNQASIKNEALMIEATLEEDAQHLYDLWDPKQIVVSKYHGARPSMYQAETLEEAAQAAKLIVLNWMSPEEPTRAIAIVGYNRLLVRRIHSLFLNESILIKDSTGWLASNLLVGKALLALVAAPSEARELVASLLHAISHRNKDGNWWDKPRDLAKSQQELFTIDTEIERLLKEFGKSAVMSPADWFLKLANSTYQEPFADYFAFDQAGLQLNTLLFMLADEFKEHQDTKLGAVEIRKLLHNTLCDSSLTVDTTDSCVTLLNPNTYNFQNYHGILLAGATADNLPSTTSRGLFNQEVRKHIQLPSQEEFLEDTRKIAANNFAKHERIAAVWHGSSAASPYLELMGAKRITSMPKLWENTEEFNEVAAVSSHSAKLHELPDRVSASNCVNLVECPYSFHSKKMLMLYEDPQSQLGRRDLFGTYVHEILEIFHLQMVVNKRKDLEQLLIGLNEFAATKNSDELSKMKLSQIAKIADIQRKLFAWEFEHYIPTYIQEINKLIAEEEFVGVVDAEKELEVEITIAGCQVKFTGSYDRKDRYKHGGVTFDSIVDVKTGSPEKYKDAHEFPQLAVYIALSATQAGIEKASYWVMNIKEGQAEISRVTPKELSTELVDGVLDDFTNIFTEALETKLPANGISSVCAYCSYSGLCRKEHWTKEKEAAK